MYIVKATFEATDRAATDNDEAAIAGVGDVIDSGAHHILQKDAHLLGVSSFGISSSRVRIDAPSLNQMGGRLDIWPFERAAIPSEFNNTCLMLARPPLLRAGEPISVLHSGNGVTGTNENWTTVLFFGDKNYQLPTGPILNVQCTGTTTLVANAWTNVPLTLSFNLPYGRYSIIGAEFFSTNGQAFRFRLPDGGPIGGGGIMSNNNLGLVPQMTWWEGLLGPMGEFWAGIAPPSVEILANAADTAETGFLRLVKIA